MITHIALFAWKEGVSDGQIAKALDDVRALKEKVPGLHDIRCGKNFSRWAEGYTHAVVVSAQDKDSLEAYRNHPDHVIVAKLIESMESKSLGVDFED
ncbi:MAG: Stress responsive alpha-beta barrel domain protein [Candidatus Peribacteria bacterium]|nr:Stress responsive alpha-beta barrel domain protein [Candidatus Peribacteria bacterium]